MLPTVGRIIHVKDPAYPDEPTCQAAIVTSVDYGPHRVEPVINLAIFNKRGDTTRTLISYQSMNWHDPKGCIFTMQDEEYLSTIQRG